MRDVFVAARGRGHGGSGAVRARGRCAGQTADGERHRRGRRERRSARHAGRDRRAGRGRQRLRRGVAAASVLGVVEPYSCGIGGGGFMVFRDGKTGKISTLDCREKSPAAMVPSSFFIDDKPPTDAQFSVNRYSGLSAGVPGTPYAWSHILRKYGTLKLKEALAYGVKRARDGFTVDQTFFNQTTPNIPYFDDIPSTAAIYLDADGTPKDVAACSATRTWRRPTSASAASAYQGLLHRAGRRRDGQGRHAAARRGDRRPYVAPRADVQARPRPLPDQEARRGPALLLRPRDLRHGPAVVGREHDRRDAEHHAGLQPPRRALRGHTGTLYHYLEASRLSYADRGRYIGDPSFVTNPIAGLLSNEYAATRAGLIGPRARRAPSPPASRPERRRPRPPRASSA